MPKDLVEVAIQYLGYPSIKYDGPDKGKTPEGFDCSGFIQFVLQEAGYKIPKLPHLDRMIRHSEEFFDSYGIPIHAEARKQGDLVFQSRNGVRPTHLGIYVGNEEMIHAPGRSNTKVGIKQIKQVHKMNYDSKKGEQIYFRNPIGYKRPTNTDKGERYHKF